MWKAILNIITFPIRILAIFLIKIYQWVISPLIPKSCRFYPTCSNYMLIAIREWGVFRGVVLGFKRILKCRPHGECGEDFVPLNVKGGLKWTY